MIGCVEKYTVSYDVICQHIVGSCRSQRLYHLTAITRISVQYTFMCVCVHILYIVYIRGPGSSVGIATELRAGRSGI